MIIHYGEPCISCEHYSADTSDENHWVCDFGHDNCPHIEALHKAVGYKEQIVADDSSSENPSKWIPVSERLPEIHNYMQEYIVTIKGNFIRTAFFTETNGKSWWSIDDVIAWMPLPEPYKASPTGAESEG